jgi:adenine/guanine phosphoribosyltransferase-like PRPP-binding protein
MNTLNQEIDRFRITPDGQIIQGASHTCRVLNHKVRNKYIIQTFSDIRKLQLDFDTIVASGISGLMVAPPVAELLDKNLCVVRTTSKCYSEFVVEGVVPSRYIIIDDLICSGSTIKRIMREMKEHAPRSICIGVYTYITEECAYRNAPKLCLRDLKVPYLSPCPERG